MPIKLRVRNLKTGDGEIVDFETEADAARWLKDRPRFSEVMGLAGVVPIAMDLQERLKAVVRPLDDEERLTERELQLKIDKLALDRETEGRKRDLENQAKHVETMKTADPDRLMEIQWRFDSDMKLTNPADPRTITDAAREAVKAFIAERNEWVAKRGQCVGECTVKVWPGKLPPGKEERVAEGRFVPVSDAETEIRDVLRLPEILRGVFRRAPPGAEARSIEAALRARIARTSDRAAVRSARLTFDAGETGAWTIDLRKGHAKLTAGRRRSPDSTIFADAATLTAVLEGRLAGLQAFLEGRLLMRGNIALVLEVDDLLPPPARDPRAPRCHRVMADGVRSFYLEAGKRGAPVVVLVHGLGATSASFLPTVWDLSIDHHVLAVDLPGFGESDKPLRPLHPEFFARWLVSLLDALSIERATIVGNSMGGRVALEVGIRSPSRVDRLVLLAPSLAWRRYRAAVGLVRMLRPEIAITPLPVLHRLAVGVLRGLFAQPRRVPRAAMDAAADEFVRVFSTPRGRVAFFHAAREIYLEDPHGVRGFWDRLPSLSRPSLFLFGDRDWLVPRAFARHVRRALPSARCELLPDCGHVPQFELPDETHRRIRAFLSS